MEIKISFIAFFCILFAGGKSQVGQFKLYMYIVPSFICIIFFSPGSISVCELAMQMTKSPLLLYNFTTNNNWKNTYAAAHLNWHSNDGKKNEKCFHCKSSPHVSATNDNYKSLK